MSGTGNAELAGLLERQLDHAGRIFAALADLRRFRKFLAELDREPDVRKDRP